LHGLLRVRGFTQDDAHIFCRPEHVTEEVNKVITFIFDIMKDFGFKDIDIELSTQPENHIGEQSQWDMATAALRESLEQSGITYVVNEGDGAFYGPKIDFKLKDAIGRSWQCGTVQCDFSLPERFDLAYTDQDGQSKRPIMLHRAILGSLERFIGTLIEHYAGQFPAWLAPTQVILIPIQEEVAAYANTLKTMLTDKNVRVDIDARNESLGKRIREGTMRKVPYILVLGQKEMEANLVAVRKYGQGDEGTMSAQDFIKRLEKEIIDKI
jgi:threonyl-tRNA synthetase